MIRRLLARLRRKPIRVGLFVTSREGDLVADLTPQLTSAIARWEARNGRPYGSDDIVRRSREAGIL